MDQVICPFCGTVIAGGGLAPGQEVICPSCGGVLPALGRENGPSVGCGYNQSGVNTTFFPATPAEDASSSDAALPAAESSGLRVVIFSLVGLTVFLIALIGVVVGARQIRSMMAGRDAPPRPTTLADWIGQLENGPSKAKKAAAEEIVRRGPEAVVAALDATTKISESGNMLHSPAVVLALATVGPSATDALGKALGSEKPNVRAAAASVLRVMGPEAKGAVGPLAAALSDQQRLVRWFAADALCNIGPDAAGAVSALTAAVGHRDRFTRRWAAVALGRIGPAAKDAVDALTGARDEDVDRLVRKAATVALYQINLQQIAAEATARADERVRGLIEKLAVDDEHESVSAAHALRDLGRQAVDAVAPLTLALGHENKWLREAAADALGAIGRQAWPVVPALEEAAEDKEPEVRKAVRQALEKIEPTTKPS